MPELPEVEVVRQQLQTELKDHPQIDKILFHRKDLRDPMPIKELKKIEGERILEIHRRAKYLVFTTSHKDHLGILSHLGMTGTWRIEINANTSRSHDHVEILFKDGRRLIYRDPRRFGILDTINTLSTEQHPRIAILGPEPLQNDFNIEYLMKQAQKSQRSRKVFIMDQKIVVGVGNIYASESLFMSGLHPEKNIQKTSNSQMEEWIKNIQKVLKNAIQAGGSTLQDFKALNGQSGYFQNQFLVYGKDGEPCPCCGRPIIAKVLGGRNSFFCKSCQK